MPFIQNCAASDINIGQFYVELPDIDIACSAVLNEWHILFSYALL